MDREERIEKEVKRLKKIFNKVSKNKKEVIKELINKASFLLILSQDMEFEIKGLDEFTVITENATQSFTKPHPLFKEYRDTIKSYQTIIKQLNDLTKNCDDENKNGPDELEEFIK